MNLLSELLSHLQKSQLLLTISEQICSVLEANKSGRDDPETTSLQVSLNSSSGQKRPRECELTCLDSSELVSKSAS